MRLTTHILSISLAIITTTVLAQPKTGFSNAAGDYAWMLQQLENRIVNSSMNDTVNFGGRPRTQFVQWIRDHVHVMKAMKYLHTDMTSFLEFYLENQTAEGIYFDYYFPLNIPGISKRKKLFDQRYWKEIPADSIEMHRLPVEADLEYLMVEGVYAVYQSGGDLNFVQKWLPALEKGMHYSMTDSLRWSKKFGLVKRGYTLDTWDFMQLPLPRKEYSAKGLDVQEGIFDIDEKTPMGIMHGDNSGMYAASNQLRAMYTILGKPDQARVWKERAEAFRTRTNTICWNGKFYKHFVEVDPQPAYLHLDQDNTLSLSNPYDINRGLPTEVMAQSIIATYKDLKEKNKDSSIAEWYGIYPPVYPHFADYLPGSYMNGGVNTIVAGELAKAAFQHGYETYGVDILQRLLALIRKYNGDLPVSYTPQGKVDEGIPDNWGQAAVYSAMIEGLAGVVDQDRLFLKTEISPRWLAAGIDSVSVNVSYPSGKKGISYTYFHDASKRQIQMTISGDSRSCRVRILLPKGTKQTSASINDKKLTVKSELVRESVYAVVDIDPSKSGTLILNYR